MKVRDVMTVEVVRALPGTTFQELVDLLVRHDVSGVPIVDEEERLVGIVTEADLISKEAYGGRRRRALELLASVVPGGETRWAVKSRARTALELMTTDVITASADDDLRRIARRMVEEGRKRLPVVDDGRLVGILSRADILAALHRSDEELEESLLALLDDPLRVPEGLALKASVNEGVIELWGTVQFPMDLAVVTAAIWQMPGVVDVRNRATSREPDPKAR